MTLAQVGQLLGSGLTPWWRAYVIAGVMLGLRPGELVGLRPGELLGLRCGRSTSPRS